MLHTGPRVPHLTDYFGFTLASLGERGVLYGCPETGDSASMLVYRPFEAWAAHSDWSVGLPAGEAVAALAAGASFCAAATTHQLLHLFSLAGALRTMGRPSLVYM